MEHRRGSWRRRAATRLRHAVFLLARPMTLGVRAAAFDNEGRVFLVRHTYLSGWHLPGGGVEPGETFLHALERELREEGHLVMNEPPILFGLYFNRQASRRDHVALYVARGIEQTAPRGADYEIAETGFFPLSALPAETAPATRRRLAEIAGESALHPDW